MYCCLSFDHYTSQYILLPFFLTGVGVFVAITNPPSVTKFLSNSSTPIMEPKRPASLVENNIDMVERSITSNGNSMSAFHLHNCKVFVKNFHVVETKCGGRLCDKRSPNSRRCACYVMQNESAPLAIVLEIEVILPDGSSFTVEFSSQWFLEQHILTGPLPRSVNRSMFDDYDVEDNLFESMLKIFRIVGRFRVTGWVRRGEMLDQGVDQPSNGLPHNAQRVMVQSSTLNYHITRLEPEDPTTVDLDELNRSRFDVVSGFRTAAASMHNASNPSS